MMPDQALEAAAKAAHRAADNHGLTAWEDLSGSRKQLYIKIARAALEAAAPHMLEEVERELTDARRVIALMASEAGGKVAISPRAITELSNDTVIETAQDVTTGGWVIRARNPRG